MNRRSRVGGLLFSLTLAACVPAQPQPRTQVIAAPAAPAPVRDPSRPEFSLTKSDLDDAVAKATAGYTLKKMTPATLDGFVPLSFPAERGTCYVAVMELGEGAAFGDHARRGVAVETRFGSEDPTDHAGAVKGPGLVANLGCPQGNGAAFVDVVANWRRALDPSHEHDLGSGPIAWKIYTKKITAAELAAKKARDEHAMADSRAEDEQVRRQRAREDAERKRAAASGPTTVTVESQCNGATVRLKWGPDPSRPSNHNLLLGPGQSDSGIMAPGDYLWIEDDRGNALTSLAIPAGVQKIVVTPACNGLSAR